MVDKDTMHNHKGHFQKEVKEMIKYLFKKYVLSIVNKTLTKYDAQAIALKIQLWLARAKIVIDLLNKAADACKDNKVDDEELESLNAEFESLVKEW